MKSSNSTYHPDSYWTEVATKISQRDSKNYLAGDDEPYYRYKRKQFLALLKEIDFAGKQVLEVGCGPGGNLEEIVKSKPSKLTGVDISQEMVNLATKNLKDSEIIILKIDGESLPFESKSIDIVLTATVLQHNTNEQMLDSIISEICRVSASQLVLFERVEKKRKGNESCEGRPVSFYQALMAKNGFELMHVKYLPISASYYFCGLIRVLFNSKNRKEGDKLNSFSLVLQRIILPFTKLLDKLYTEKRDVARITFVRKPI